MGNSHWPKDEIPQQVLDWIDWLLTPKTERQPDEQTQAEYLRAHQIPEGTLKGWRRNPRVRKAIRDRADELNLSTERIQRVINAMFKAAEQGDVKAAALVLQFTERLAPKRIIIEDRTLSGMSDEQLRQELAAAGLLADADE